MSDALVGKVRRGELYKSPGSPRSAVASDRSGWALAFYTGMRRGEIGRSQWQHVFWEANELMVAASKSDAGEGRRVPMVGPLKKILRESGHAGASQRRGRSWFAPSIRANGRLAPTRLGKEARLARVTLHEARHTYASFLMAAGYNLKQIQEYVGYADLVTTGRYIKNLPVPRGTTARQKLDAYLGSEVGDL